jgi:hypothetical protein
MIWNDQFPTNIRKNGNICLVLIENALDMRLCLSPIEIKSIIFANKNWTKSLFGGTLIHSLSLKPNNSGLGLYIYFPNL